jgi:ubiquinone/menaquinone biosynthesis C-methylase UbiE
MSKYTGMQMNELQSAFINFFKDVKNKKILDVGCGDRQYEKYLDDSNHYIGLDVEESGRNIVNKKADIFYDGMNIPLENESIDYIICTQVLEHAIDPVKLVEEFKRVLRRGGGMLRYSSIYLG